MCQQILLALPPKYIQNPHSPHHLYCYPPDPRSPSSWIVQEEPGLLQEMSNVSPPLLPTPFLTQRPEVFFYSKSGHVSPLLRVLRGLLSYRKSQSHCGLTVLNYLEHPPSPFICLTSPILYSPQCCSHNGLPTIPQKLPSMLLPCYSFAWNSLPIDICLAHSLSLLQGFT